jgi:hypothetical protein
MPRENDLEGVQDQDGKHGGQKGMPKPEPGPTTRREPRRDHAAPDQSCVMSADRSSRGTRSVLSKSAERIRSGDESGKSAHCGSGSASRSNRMLRSRLDCRSFRSPNAGRQYAAGNPCEPTGLAASQPNARRARYRYRHQNSTKLRLPPIEPFRTSSLACRPSCSLAYFQPRRVRPRSISGRAIRSIKVAVVRLKRQPPLPLYRPFEPDPHVCLD